MDGHGGSKVGYTREIIRISNALLSEGLGVSHGDEQLGLFSGLPWISQLVTEQDLTVSQDMVR